MQAGCDRTTILGHLTLIRDAARFDDVEFWTGRSRRDLHAVRRLLVTCATMVDSLITHPLKIVLAGLTGRSSLVMQAADFGCCHDATGGRQFGRLAALSSLAD